MGLERRTVIDQIEIKRDGTVQVRLAKQVVDGEDVLRNEYHRIGVEPSADVESYLPVVNAHLESMREAAVEEAEWDRVRRVVNMEHTPEVKEAYVVRQRAEAEKQDALMEGASQPDRAASQATGA